MLARIKPIIFALALLPALFLTEAKAQDEEHSIRIDTAFPSRKWDGAIQFLLEDREGRDTAQTRSANRMTRSTLPYSSSADSDDLVRILITAANAPALAERIAVWGYTATSITPTLLTASVPLDSIESLAALEGESAVVSIALSKKMQTSTLHVREKTGIDSLHSGIELETPYKGSGVLVGVIDEGFEYQHVAFLDKDGSSRLRALWLRQESDTTSPITSNFPTGGDNSSNGHATHVAGIAAGSDLGLTEYYGIAPEADLVFISTALDEAEILEDIAYIKQLANEEGMPWVVNMSFGGELGSHDGQTAASKAIDALSEAGGILVGAAGNEGDLEMHATHSFEKADTVYLLIDETGSSYPGEIVFDLWGMDADGKQHLTVSPISYTNGNVATVSPSNILANGGVISAEIDANNKKEHYLFYFNTDQLRQNLRATSAKFGIRIIGKSGTTFHVWNSPYAGSFYTPSSGNIDSDKFLTGDTDYTINDWPASTESVIAVGAYINQLSYTLISDYYTYSAGTTIKLAGETADAIATYSSHGPWFGEGQKPTVCAPGTGVASSCSKYITDFSTSTEILTDIVTFDGETYYYSVMSGTSMATPVVTGTIALWLEANPELTYEDIEEIIRQTATRDSYTGDCSAGDDTWGYGKINAYQGLKAALQKAEASGINSTMNIAQPLTLLKSGAEWKLLLGSSESFVDITVVALDGRTVYRQTYQNLSRGQELTLPLSGLTSGVYVVNIRTTASQLSRKLVLNTAE